MPTKEITKAQIDELFGFVRRKRVRYYDLQVELVDHLATGIEQIWEKEPDVSFERARDRVYKEFGIFGFAHVVDERIQAINRQVWEEAYAFMRSTFTFPKIILTLTIPILIAQLLMIAANPFILTTSLFFLFLAVVLYYHWKKPPFRHKKVQFARTAGTHNALGILGGLGQILLFYMPYWIEQLASYGVVFASLSGVIVYYVYVMLYALTVHADQRAREDLQKQFPRLVAG